jgi:hypothetical protein
LRPQNGHRRGAGFGLGFDFGFGFFIVVPSVAPRAPSGGPASASRARA